MREKSYSSRSVTALVWTWCSFWEGWLFGYFLGPLWALAWFVGWLVLRLFFELGRKARG